MLCSTDVIARVGELPGSRPLGSTGMASKVEKQPKLKLSCSTDVIAKAEEQVHRIVAIRLN
jgi:hypothetical protein